MTIDREIIDQALARPESFGWWGDEKYFVTWGLCGPAHAINSGDTLQQSNFEVIRDDLQERFPGEIEVVPTNHWAAGPLDQLGVHVINDDGTPTECFMALMEWREKLEAYPVADEEHLSALEWDDLVKYVSGYTTFSLPENTSLRDELPEDWATQVASKLNEDHSVCRVEDISDDGIMAAAAQELGFTEGTHER